MLMQGSGIQLAIKLLACIKKWVDTKLIECSDLKPILNPIVERKERSESRK